jgi:Integrase core domain
MSKQQLVNELFKPIKRKFERRRVVVKGLHDLLQLDLMDMQNLRKENRAYRYVLIGINVFSKKVFCVALKDKKAVNVVAAAEKILDGFGHPFKLVATDQGSEFQSAFLKMLKERGIKHYYTYNETKAQVVERVIRTIRNLIYRSMALRGTLNYVDTLQEIVDIYNNRYHHKIKMPPNEVSEKNEKQLLDTVYKYKSAAGEPKYKEGDTVRVSNKKFVFNKGYYFQWSTELFKIEKIYRKHPVMYVLSNLDGNETIKGAFYEPEIQKTEQPDVYLVEKILQRKKNLVKVRFLGLGSESDQWIKKSELI